MRKLASAIVLLLAIAPAMRAQRPVCIVNGVRIDNGGPMGGAPYLRGADMKDAIESVEVLKGAAAVKMYGGDAVNGVVLITTKKDAGTAHNWGSACGMPTLPEADPFAKLLYAPELVMAHQEALRLTDRQRTAISDAVKEIHAKATDAQLKLAASGERLTRLLAGNSVDEAAVLQQIDQVLSLEREVKRAQITLLVRVKNQLTPEQQGILDKLR